MSPHKTCAASLHSNLNTVQPKNSTGKLLLTGFLSPAEMVISLFSWRKMSKYLKSTWGLQKKMAPAAPADIPMSLQLLQCPKDPWWELCWTTPCAVKLKEVPRPYQHSTALFSSGPSCVAAALGTPKAPPVYSKAWLSALVQSHKDASTPLFSLCRQRCSSPLQGPLPKTWILALWFTPKHTNNCKISE